MLQHQRHSVEAMRSLCQKMRRRVYENWTGLMYKKGISVDVANPLYVDVTIYCRINLSQNFSNSSFEDRSFMMKKLPLLIPHLICQS